MDWGGSSRDWCPHTNSKVWTQTQREECQVKMEAVRGLQAQDCGPPPGAGREAKNRFPL